MSAVSQWSCLSGSWRWETVLGFIFGCVNIPWLSCELWRDLSKHPSDCWGFFVLRSSHTSLEELELWNFVFPAMHRAEMRIFLGIVCKQPVPCALCSPLPSSLCSEQFEMLIFVNVVLRTSFSCRAAFMAFRYPRYLGGRVYLALIMTKLRKTLIHQ